MTDKEIIRAEAERLKKQNGYLPIDRTELCEAYQARGYQLACDDFLSFINSMSEESASKDLEEEIDRVFFKNECRSQRLHHKEIADIARHFANWQKQKDADLIFNAKEDGYRLGKASVQLNMKEALRMEYEKGRYDMREEIMKDAIDSKIEGTYYFHSDRAQDYGEIRDFARIAPIEGKYPYGQKVKIIISKEN